MHDADATIPVALDAIRRSLRRHADRKVSYATQFVLLTWAGYKPSEIRPRLQWDREPVEISDKQWRAVRRWAAEATEELRG